MACDTMPCPTRWLGQRIFVRRADYLLDMRGDNANNKQEDEVKGSTSKVRIFPSLRLKVKKREPVAENADVI